MAKTGASVQSVSLFASYKVAMSSRRKSTPIRVSRTYMNELTSCARALTLMLKGRAGDSVNRIEKAPDLALDGGSGAERLQPHGTRYRG
jgi:hypothetical protein